MTCKNTGRNLLPHVDLPELLMEIHSRTGSDEDFATLMNPKTEHANWVRAAPGSAATPINGPGCGPFVVANPPGACEDSRFPPVADYLTREAESPAIMIAGV
jgi:hypothetical protein